MAAGQILSGFSIQQNRTTMAENTPPSGKRRAIQLGALFFILVVLPLGTLYYTRSGHEYYKELISEFHDYGQMPAFQFTSHQGQTITNATVKGKLVVAGFFSPDDPKSLFLGQQLAKLHRNFDDDNRVLFLLHSLHSPSNDRLEAFAQKTGLTDVEQCHLLTSSQQDIYNHLNKGFQWPDDYGKSDRSTPYRMRRVDPSVGTYPYLVLVDTRSNIRNYYAFEDNRAMARLVEHMALLAPGRGDKDPELVRDKEK